MAGLASGKIAETVAMGHLSIVNIELHRAPERWRP